MTYELRCAMLILLSGAITYALRAAPFLLFRNGLPKTVASLASALPPAIMATLVVYCLKGAATQSLSASLPMLIASAATAALHAWKRSAPLSIAGGTVLYMVLLRFI